MKKARKGKSPKKKAEWPALPLLEYTMGLSRLMAARPMNKAALARAADVEPPYISSVMAGNENLTLETMQKLAKAAGGEVHVCVVDRGVRVRWVEDDLAEIVRPQAGAPYYAISKDFNVDWPGQPVN